MSRWRRKNEPEKYDCFKCFQADREASTPVYFPPDVKPLPDRGPVEQSGDRNAEGNDESGTVPST